MKVHESFIYSPAFRPGYLEGYTGTQICVDQVRQLIVVLLTNRVYPQASDESEDKIHTARQLFSNLVKDIYDNQTHVEQQPHLSFSA